MEPWTEEFSTRIWPVDTEDTEEFTLKDPQTGQMITRVGHEVYCVNCREHGHTAGSRVCPIRVSQQQRMDEKRSASRPAVRAPRQTRTNHIVRPGMSYANATRPQDAAPAVAPARGSHNLPQVAGGSPNLLNAARSINEDVKRIFGGDLLSTMRKVQPFAKDYAKLKTDEDKAAALMTIFLSINSNV